MSEVRKQWNGGRSRIVMPPAPGWDVEGTESWLFDMEKAGWRLAKNGFFLGLARFERVEPGEAVYRLDAAQTRRSLWDDRGGEPDEDAKALAAACGWEYVASRGQFYVYRAEGAHRELHTDPAIQSIAVNAVRKREISSIVSFVLWAAAFLLLSLRGNLLLAVLEAGAPLAAVTLLTLGLLLTHSIVSAVYLSRLRRRLAAGEPPDHRRPWRGRAAGYRVLTLAAALCVLLTGILFVQRWNRSLMRGDWAPLANYPGDPPFATMADIPGVKSYKPDSFYESNTFRSRRSVPTPVLVDWDELATVTLTDGRTVDGGLEVHYYEAASPLIAREIARELTVRARGERHYQPLALPELGMDYAHAYSAYFPEVILRSGNRVLHARFYQTGPEDGKLTLEDWVGLLADSIN